MADSQWHGRGIARLEGFAWPLAILLAFVVLQVVFVTATPWDWWFEDDTPHLVFVRDHRNPLGYFFDAELIRGLSLGHAVTPWFPFTFWVDSIIAPLSPLVAYLHTGFSLTLTAWLFFLLLRRFMDARFALATACLWLFLPSTIVITEFLSTRHYLEGLALSIAALLCATRGTGIETGSAAVAESESRPWRLRSLFWPASGDWVIDRWMLLAAVFYLLASSAKEIYVSSTLFMLFWIYARAGKRSALAILLGCGLTYACYRLWSLGLVGKNLGSDLFTGYSRFPVRVFYTFSGNWSGYLVLVAAIGVAVALLLKKRLTLDQLSFFFTNLGVMFVTLIPVSVVLAFHYQSLGTWYRVVFLLNTFFVGCLGWLLARWHRRGLAVGLALMVGISVIWGGLETAGRWDVLKAQHKRDADFYLAHPDRLLYSDLPAYWYMYGVHHLYQEGMPIHYLTWRVNPDSPIDVNRILELLDSYSEVWRVDGTEYRADPDLAERIRLNCLAGRNPLDRDVADLKEQALNHEADLAVPGAAESP